MPSLANLLSISLSQNETTILVKRKVQVSTGFTSILVLMRTLTVATASRKEATITSTKKLQLSTGPGSHVTLGSKRRTMGLRMTSCQMIDMWISKDGYFSSVLLNT